MRLLSLLLLLLAMPVQAQSPAVRAALLGGPGYVGLGDIYPGATLYWGLRAYNAAAALAGIRAINIRRASDNATTDIFLLKNGSLDIGTATAFCAATTCYLTETYDQTGNGHHATQATAGNQPQLAFNCIGIRPCIEIFSASTNQLASTLGNVLTTASMVTVEERTANFTSFAGLLADTNGYGLSYNNTANTLLMNQNGTSFTAGSVADSAWHSYIGLLTGGAGSSIVADGVTTSGTVGAAAFGTGLNLGSGNGSFFTGYVGEAGVWANANAPAKAMCHNQFVYWGTSVAC